MSSAVWKLPCPLETKAVILWLLEQSAVRVYDADEIGKALGLHRSVVEDAINKGQRCRPPALALVGPDGEKLRPRHAFLPVDLSLIHI